MIHLKPHDQRRGVLAPVLPTTYVLLVLLTAALSPRTDGLAYDRIVGADPIGMAFMMTFNSPIAILLGFLITGTPWWYFIGRMCSDSRKGRIGRVTSVLGFILASGTFWTVAKLTADALTHDIHHQIRSMSLILQYSLVAILCMGALVSALFLFRAIFRRGGLEARTPI
jgi:hypothetical protein